MKLVPADYVTEEDLQSQHLLEQHPIFKWHLALLLNSYRELAQLCMRNMQEGETDTADVTISLSKKDTIALRYGIPLFDEMGDWWEARLELDKARDRLDGKEEA